MTVVSRIAAGILWCLATSFPAHADEAGGRSIDIVQASFAAEINGISAPFGFQFLTLDIRFANVGDDAIENVTLGMQTLVLEDGLFPHFLEKTVGPVDQSTYWQPLTIAPQQGIEVALVFSVPENPAALALVYEADGIRLEEPVGGAEDAPPAATAEAGPAPAEPDPRLSLAAGQVDPGERLVVGFENAGALADDAWLGILPASFPRNDEAAAEAAAISPQFLDGRAEGRVTMRAPTEPGAYEVRLFASDRDGDEVALAAFTVVGAVAEPEPAPVAEPEPAPVAEPAPPVAAEPPAEAEPPAIPSTTAVAVTLDRTAVQPNQTLVATVAAAEALGETAWIAIVPADVPHGDESVIAENYVTWAWIRNLADGTWTVNAPIPYGAYEVRVMADDAGGPDIAWIGFEVAPPEIISFTAPDWVLPGSEVVVAFEVSGALSDSAWLALVPATAPPGDDDITDQHDIAYAYANSLQGAWAFAAPAQFGRYEVRLLADTLGGPRIASVRFEVRPSPPWGEVPLLTAEQPVNVADRAFGAYAISGVNPQYLNDDDETIDPGDYYTYANVGDPIELVLDRPYEIERIVLRLWDGDDRGYRYRVEGSLDGESWQSLAERGDTDYRGEQDIEITPRILRHIRVTGLANTANNQFHLVELRAFARKDVIATTVGFVNTEDNWNARYNLGLSVWGARVVDASSARADADALIDGRLDGAAWVVAEGDDAPSVTLGFLDDRPIVFDALGFRFDDDGGHAQPRLIRIDAADAPDADDWRHVETFVFNAEGGYQSRYVGSKDARFLRFTIVDAFDQGDGRPALREISIYGDTGVDDNPYAYRQPGFDGGVNVALEGYGGLVARTSATADGSERKLIDGGVGPDWGWIAAAPAYPVDIVIDLPGDAPARLGGFAINPWSGDDAPPPTAPRLVELWVSPTGSDGGFEMVGRYMLDRWGFHQVFAFAPVEARAAMVRVLENWGGDSLSIGDIELLEVAGPQGETVLPAGGPVVSYTNWGGHVAIPAGFNRMALLDRGARSVAPWRSEPGALAPIDLVFGFGIGATPPIHRLVVRPSHPAADPADWLRRVKVFVSDSSPIDGFEQVADMTFPQTDTDHAIDFEPVAARYVRLRLLENYGGESFILGGVDIIENVTADTPSITRRLMNGGIGSAVAPEIEDSAARRDLAASEVEPNDTPAAATALDFDQPVVALIDPPADIDLYRVDTSGLPHPGLGLAFAEDPVLRIGMRLKRGDGSEIDARPLYETIGAEAEFFWHLPQASYLVEVDRPLTSVVVLSDLSPSTDEVRDEITAALSSFVQQTSPSEQVVIAGFCGGLDRVTDFTSDRAVLTDAVEAINYGCGGTDLYGAMMAAMDWLADRPGTKAVVMITDGYHYGRHNEELYAAIDRLGESGVRFYSIGYGFGLHSYVMADDDNLDLALGATGNQQLEAFARATGARYYEAPSGDQIERVTGLIAEELREVSRYTLTASVPAGEGGLRVIEVGESIAGVSAPSQIALILDASGSMRGRTDTGAVKMDVAKDVMRLVIAGLPDATQVGLRVYGHRYNRNPKSRSCTDSELVVPFGELDRARLVAAVEAIQPKGQTPIGLSLAQLPADFGDSPGQKVVILVTDGIETCDPGPGTANYPPDVVSRLIAAGIEVKVNVIGFDIGESETRAFLTQIASRSGGQYFDAANADELQAALQEAIRADFSVRDSAGAVVVESRVGDPSLALPEGLYTIRLEVEPPLEVPDTRVEIDRETRVHLDKEGAKVGVDAATVEADAPLPAGARLPSADVAGLPSASGAPASPGRIAALLAEARDLVAARQLTTPAGAAAVDRYREVLAADSQNADARAGLATVAAFYDLWARAAISAGWPEQAVDHYRTAISVVANDPALYAGLGDALWRSGQPDAAREAFEAALGLDPQDAAARDRIAALDTPPPAPGTATESTLPAALSGVPTVVDSGTLVIDGRIVPLIGVAGEGGAQADSLGAYLAGQSVSCALERGQEYRCMVGDVDLSQVVLYNGGARATEAAPPELKSAEADARAAGRGVWQ